MDLLNVNGSPYFFFILLFIGVALIGCSTSPSLEPQSYDPPGATDTRDKEIAFQSRSVFAFQQEGVFFSNDFEGGRLLEVEKEANGIYSGQITPENHPINNSAWFAFNAWARQSMTIHITLRYSNGKHRYWPKTSTDRVYWIPLDSSQVIVAEDERSATFELNLGPDTLWIAGQELITNDVFDRWQQKLTKLPYIRHQVLGESRAGRPIHMLELTESEKPEAYLLVIGRQHPPEIAGSIGLTSFIETIAADSELANAFRKRFAVWAIPVVNPDGVAEGHWRHNTGGIDLNRDWHAFNQPETRLVRDHFLQLKQNNQSVIAAIDFHATRYDIMYTLDRNLLPGDDFTDTWLDAIRTQIPTYNLIDEPGGLGSPISKNWFYETFNAPAFTYEVGDETDRDLIEEVAVTAANAMMELALDTTR
ncbi:MAG: hypothetical protein KTR29_24875 [Rhodothermaceae bacterium]|nr:hypothetical protein [Rhodothermaceae bacterium]